MSGARSLGIMGCSSQQGACATTLAHADAFVRSLGRGQSSARVRLKLHVWLLCEPWFNLWFTPAVGRSPEPSIVILRPELSGVWWIWWCTNRFLCKQAQGACVIPCLLFDRHTSYLQLQLMNWMWQFKGSLLGQLIEFDVFFVSWGPRLLFLLTHLNHRPALNSKFNVKVFKHTFLSSWPKGLL